MDTIIYYSTGADDIGEKLMDIMETYSPDWQKTVCRSMHSLAYRTLFMRKNFKLGETVLILVASNSKELQEVHSFRDALSDYRLILVLPNHKEETIARGHELYPRFLTYTDGDYSEIVSVLHRMQKAA